MNLILPFFRNRYPVLIHLPYSPAGPQVVHVASWTHLRGLVVTEGHVLFPEKFSKYVKIYVLLLLRKLLATCLDFTYINYKVIKQQHITPVSTVLG